VARYALAQFAFTLACAVHFLQVQAHAPVWQSAAYLAFIVASLTGIGGLLEGRRRWVLIEIARLLLATGIVLASGHWFGTGALAEPLRWGIVAVAVASALAALAAYRSLSPAHSPGLPAT
jgi:hypothetical protein